MFSDIEPKEFYEGNGVNTVFDYSFDLYLDDDTTLEVYYTDINSITIKLTLGVDYTVDTGLKKVTLLSIVPADDEYIAIYRKTVSEQTWDSTGKTYLNLATFEGIFDKLVAITQENQVDLQRIITIQKGNSDKNILVKGIPNVQESYILSFDSDGNLAVTNPAGLLPEINETFLNYLATAEGYTEQTGLDATATAADVIQTGLDATATAADVSTITILLTDIIFNYFHNAGMTNYNRSSNKTLSNGVYVYPIDRWACMTEGTAVTSGTAELKTDSSISDSGHSLILKNVTATGVAVSYIRQRLGSKDALSLKNKTQSNGLDVLHDVGSAINYTVILRKPNALNDFTLATEIVNSGVISVASGVKTRIKLEDEALGDITNGLEIEYKIEHGAITNKNFEFSNAKLEIGSVCTNYIGKSYSTDLEKCLVYYNKLSPSNVGYGYYPFLTGGINLQSSGFSISGRPAQFVYSFPIDMIKPPSFILNGTWGLSYLGGATTISAYGVANASTKGLSFVAGDGTVLTPGFSSIYAITAGANMEFDAEL